MTSLKDVVKGKIFGGKVIYRSDMSDDPKTEPEEVVVDQAMLDENPQLAEAGIEVGDVGRPATEEEAAQLDAEAPAAAEPEAA